MTLHSIIEQFDDLMDVPDSVSKLRQFILQLAVQGKLTEQDPSDEPAEQLLERIQAEKQRLYEAGEIRKPRSLDPVSGKEVWHPIPNHWVWTKLGEVGRIKGGNTPKTSVDEYWAHDGIPWLTPADLNGLQSKTISRGARDISQSGLDNCSAKLLPTGTVLFSSRAPIGYVAIAANPIATNQGFKNVRPYEMGMSEYIYYFLKFAGKRINREASGTTFTEVSGKDVANIPFPLPPLEEQQRIVATVDRLMDEYDTLEAQQEAAARVRVRCTEAATHALQTADTPAAVRTAWHRLRDHFATLTATPDAVDAVRQTILQLAVQGKLTEQDPSDEPAEVLLERIQAEKQRLYEAGEIRKPKTAKPIEEEKDLATLSEGWAWARLANVIVEGPRNGYSPKTVEYKTDVKRLDLSATTSGYFKPGYFEYVDESIEVDSPLWLEDGDILIQRGNSIEYVGIAAIYDGPDKEYIYPDLMMRLKPSENISTKFLHQALITKATRDYYRSNASGTSGSMPKINQGVVLNTLIPVPPRKEQQRIVATVERLMDACDTLETQLSRQQALGAELLDAVLHAAAQGDEQPALVEAVTAG